MRRHTTDIPASRLRRRMVAVLVSSLYLGAGFVPGAGAAVGAQSDTERERDEIREHESRLSEELDVLEATNGQITAALDDLDARIAAQQLASDAAATAATAAEAESRDAADALRRAERDVSLLEQAIRDMAVASYVHPPTADLVQSLQASTLSDALIQKTYLDARAERDLSLLELLEVARGEAARTAVAAAEAVQVAEGAAAVAAEQLAALRTEQDELAVFAADLQQRIDGALAEAAALADLDAALSEQIVREQAELIARLPPPPPPVVEVEEPVVSGPEPAEPAAEVEPPDTDADESADDAEEEDTTEDEDEAAQGDEDEDGGSTRPRVPTPPLETVQGITIHADIAADLDAMLAAAAADGIDFGGSGYRSTDRQIELRVAHCGPTDYDIWEKPASACHPPTAIPGRSMHEHGRAVDLTFDGRLITSRDNDGFRWLSEHAGAYGFVNLPSEPWHWSTNGQ